MSKDLEETLSELGPDYRALVARLRSAANADSGRDERGGVRVCPRRQNSVAGRETKTAPALPKFLVAASLAALFGFAALLTAGKFGAFNGNSSRKNADEIAATGATADAGANAAAIFNPHLVASSPYALALDPNGGNIEQIVRTQRADGSWASDYLTRQNAAALKAFAAASPAYRRAERYLRAKGLAPLSAEELQHNRHLADNRMM